jgi:S1-C subfamily serine protease
MIAKRTVFDLAKALEGLPVLGCLAGTPAAMAGVRYGDILLSVNGMRTKTLGDFVEAKGLRKDGMHVVIFRSGEEQPIELEYRAERQALDPTAVVAELATMRLLGTEVEGDGTVS